MNEKKIVLNGKEYLRADLVKPKKSKIKVRKYIVLSSGQDNQGESVFLRLKGIKAVVFKPGDQIEIQIIKTSEKEEKKNPDQPGLV